VVVVGAVALAGESSIGGLATARTGVVPVLVNT